MDGRTRTLTMNWDRIIDDEDDDHFFESLDRISSAVPQDLDHSLEEDENYDDSRMSFASALSSASFKNISPGGYARSLPPMLENYDVWMAEPGSITERRKRLLQGMGLASNKDLLKIASAKMARAVTNKVDEIHIPSDHNIDPSSDTANESKPADFPSSRPVLLVRSRSDGDIVTLSLNTKRRKEKLIGSTSKQLLTRTSSMLATRQIGICQYANSKKISPSKSNQKAVVPTSERLPCKTNQKAVVPFSGPLSMADGALASFFLIKNLDTGNEFIVKEYNEQGMWNKLSDLQTGKQLTMEEFEKSVGYSPE